MLPILRRGLPLILLCFPLLLPADEPVFTLDADVWTQPRDAGSLVAEPALRSLLSRYEARGGGQVILRHPPGEQGRLWASELQDWLVALGVPSADIIRVSGEGMAGRMELSLQPLP
ncbi:hypothetical protein [Ectothiorhodospira lacustris]|uniref:hypothetical protein n=1 Tax=Ectothiorhodospira lacustris TaxID=2899127 RepID=UPI001EE95755|nr:hypothetical protein [Ectothiorhodospira lacustris]MCG5500641.1 hypothetical protein [Ectothiorhodospira lacustris]MCG5508950.1 hypothetical protein [Ectothiorhodospira lacustris]MCG5520741.1 hypothetical protein [Ectothiorhodospira lacustris]